MGSSGQKTDRKTTLTGFGNLQNLFNFGLNTSSGLMKSGGATVNQGTNALGSALSYWQNILSGNRQQMAAAAAPETNAVNASADAARRNQTLSGTSRVGGVASQNRTASDTTMSTIDNYLFGVRPTAAQGVSDVGGKLAQVGLGEENIGLGFAGLAEKSTADMTDAAIKSRPDSYAINQQTVQQVTSAINSVLDAIF